MTSIISNRINDRGTRPETIACSRLPGAQPAIRGRDTDTLARIGGGEFCVLLPHTNAAGAVYLADAMRKAVAELPVEFNGQPIPLTISIGVASSSQQIPSPSDQMLSPADKALYQSKQAGRNRVTLFDPGAKAFTNSEQSL